MATCAGSVVRKEKQGSAAEVLERNTRLIRRRWFVPPSMLVISLTAWGLGFRFELGVVVMMTLAVGIYNFVLSELFRGIDVTSDSRDSPVRLLTHLQVLLDGFALLILIHFVGGVDGPLTLLLVFYTLTWFTYFAPYPGRRLIAFTFLAVFLVGVAEITALWKIHPLFFHDQPVGMFAALGSTSEKAAALLVLLGLGAIGTISVIDAGVTRFAAMSSGAREIDELNERLQLLFTMTQAIVSKQHLEQVLSIGKVELARVLQVQGVSVKLLEPDGKRLRYVAVHGLPEEQAKSVVDVGRSPLNRKVVEGEPYVVGEIPEIQSFQFGTLLLEKGFKSVLFVALLVEQKIIGVLGLYSDTAERFGPKEIGFCRQAAGLVAIALENARAYESIEKLLEDRSRFMWKVAHNLRAPLAATIGILDVVRGGHLGTLTDGQKEYLRRVDRRARAMASMINELMSLAKSRSEQRQIRPIPVDLKALSGRLQRTFQEVALQKGLELRIAVGPDVTKILGDPDALETMLENLVSNAIKYSLRGGVFVDFSQLTPDKVRIEIRDTGIGIPEGDQDKLFTDFFRAENARAVDEIGTGLGLSLVKETVESHGGRIHVVSKVDQGTTITVTFPAATEEAP